MAEVVFFFAAIGALAGAVGTVVVRNPFYSVLALVSHLLCLALLFLLLRSEFVAAAQVVVYAGAVMVLYVFVVAYVGGNQMPLGPETTRGARIGAIAFAGALFVELAIAILGTGLKALSTQGAPYKAGFGTPEAIGQALLTKFLFPFEAASFLLLAAAVGAVTLARRRGGLHSGEEHHISAADLLRPMNTGTQAESVGTQTGRQQAERIAAGHSPRHTAQVGAGREDV